MSKKQKPTGNTGRKNQIKGKYAERSRKNGFGKFCLILQVIMSAAFMGVLSSQSIIRNQKFTQMPLQWPLQHLD